ncbi:MAG: sulfite reductase subunit beta [Pirellulaceae bacterium]|nr:MAG: sulfite reductase subunit beta [Pirellulaceae bacterium]
MADQDALSKVELGKIASRYLRATIAEELSEPTDHFSDASAGILKFHGSYQEDDRDLRSGQERHYIFMVRTKIPGGRLSSDQLLAELDLCDQLGNTTLRITSRQGLQLHGVVKRNLWPVIHRINEVQLTTLGACGDVNRNVMCCPAPFKTAVHQTIESFSDQLARHFAPRTPAYAEIWLTDVRTGQQQKWDLQQQPEQDGAAGDEVEPIYGRQYLPRKFKMAIALPQDNCVDVLTDDLGLVAVVESGQVCGYNVYVGGGQGMTPSNKKTFPALGQPLAFAETGEVLGVVEAVVKVYRDFGNRHDRKRARLKYVVHDWGIEAFRAKVAEYYGKPLREPASVQLQDFDDHIGWYEQGDGRWFYGLNVENGRLKDTGTMQLKSAVREICRTLRPAIRLTPHQSILFADLAPDQRPELERILRAHHVPLSEEISQVRRWSMACVAWPTCNLSITEAERVLPGIIDQLESELERLGLEDERMTVRMTGCPNGCARPYNCDIGLVGRARDRYSIYVGGRVLGDRLNFLYKDLVPLDEIVPTLVPLLVYFRQARQPGESFGEFCHRLGLDALRQWVESTEAAPATADRS